MFNRLREDISVVLERDPAARNRWEVLSCYPGVRALIYYRWANRLWRGNFRWLARKLAEHARRRTGIEIHPAALIGRRVFIDHGMGLVIGETAEVGDECTLYHGVTLGGTTWNKIKRHPTLGRGVVVGAGAKILGPIVVGDGARIGANAVVLKDVEAGATMVGIPARALERSYEGDDEARFTPYGVADSTVDAMSAPTAAPIAGPAGHATRLEPVISSPRPTPPPAATPPPDTAPIATPTPVREQARQRVEQAHRVESQEQQGELDNRIQKIMNELDELEHLVVEQQSRTEAARKFPESQN